MPRRGLLLNHAQDVAGRAVPLPVPRLRIALVFASSRAPGMSTTFMVQGVTLTAPLLVQPGHAAWRRLQAGRPRTLSMKPGVSMMVRFGQ